MARLHRDHGTAAAVGVASSLGRMWSLRMRVEKPPERAFNCRGGGGKGEGPLTLTLPKGRVEKIRRHEADSASADLMGEANLTKSDSELEFGDLRAAWLEAFVLTVDNKKRTAAAAQMEVSEDTVTKNIAKLERWLGGGPRRLLLWPNTYPPALTDAGKHFLPDARDILDLMRKARELPVVTEVPIKLVSTAHLRVPPPVASVQEEDGTITGADRDRPGPAG